MANTLTSLIPTLYEAVDTVSRELVGFIPAVAKNSSAARAALNESILVPITPAITLQTVTPGLYAADNGDDVIGNASITIASSKYAPVRFNGEETVGLGNAGTYSPIVRQRFEQAFRAICNAVESDCAALHSSCSGAYGVSATTPFTTAGDLSHAAYSRKALTDRGAPISDLQMVLGSTAGAKLRAVQSSLFKVNEAGTDAMLRDGSFGKLEGFSLHESGGVKTFTAGTMASATTNNAGYALGATTLTLATAGTGVVAAGDVITITGDTNMYVVKSATFAGGNPAAGDTIVLASPGLLKAIPASATAITVSATSVRNMVFDRNAIQLVTRAPAMPEGGDMADDKMMITDPRSGLVFEVAVYRQYRQVKYEVALAWGAAMTKPDHAIVLLG